MIKKTLSKIGEEYQRFIDSCLPTKSAAEILAETAPEPCQHWECPYYGCQFRESYTADAEHYWFLPRTLEEAKKCELYMDV